MKHRMISLLLAMMICLQITPGSAREGDTLEPIQIEAPALETSPEDLLAQSDFDAIEGRVFEARNAGVPVAVRIVDVTQESGDLPFPIRQYASSDFSQPISGERQQAILNAWIRDEVIETSADANDGFLLLVLVPEDRSQTQALWWIGDNALPLNGLTQENVLATQVVMNAEFAQGNMPNGVFMGISEFSYNVQFGVPERLERTRIGRALHAAVMPLAVGTMAAGFAIPALAWWLARRNTFSDRIDKEINAWLAAALCRGRSSAAITAAMLLDAVHSGEFTPGRDGSVRVEPKAGNPAIEQLRLYANDDGIVPATTMLEINAITRPVITTIDDDLAAIGAFTARVYVDRTWMLLAMAIAVLMSALAVVPTVASMSALGVFAITVAAAGVMIGWWWLTHRRYTSPAGEQLLAEWLENASARDRHLFDTATHLDLLTDQIGGPNVNAQSRLIRQLRGLGAG